MSVCGDGWVRAEGWPAMTRLDATRPKLDASTSHSIPPIPPHTFSRAMGINGQVSIFPIDALYSNEKQPSESGTFWAMAR